MLLSVGSGIELFRARYVLIAAGVQTNAKEAAVIWEDPFFSAYDLDDILWKK